jgi:acyl-CoA thioesterase FadM
VSVRRAASPSARRIFAVSSISAAAAADLCDEGRFGGKTVGGGMAAGWSETCRSTVRPWECDVTEHFTIAYYFDRIDEAAIAFADCLGLAAELRAGVLPRRLRLRFVRELRAGAGFHVESAALWLDPGLRLGHRFVDSASGDVVTWVEEVWEAATPSAAQREAIASRLVVWNGPESEARKEPRSTAGSIATARGLVQPADLDEFGRCSLAGFVHRFTDALLQAAAAIGMTADYMKAERRGFSTFELLLTIAAPRRLGEPYLVETGIAHLGTTSLRLLHRMTDPRSGAELARLGQFGVHLDLDARRPAPWPEAIRAAAAPLVLPLD